MTENRPPGGQGVEGPPHAYPPLTVAATPDSRHSLADVRYRADFVRITPESRRGSGRSRESVVDPKATFARFQSRWLPNTDSEDGWSQIERVPAPSLLIIVEREMAESPTT